MAELARRGAAVRLAELAREVAEIYRLAPELFAAPPSIHQRKRPRGRPRSERRGKLPKPAADCRAPAVH
jgi:hypothetical protein